ncbi:MAG: hypothetical protein WBM00_08025 [Solirubrobacterales bacterium]
MAHLAEQRALRVYGHLAGALRTPVRELQAIGANERAITELASTWVEAFAVGLGLEDEPPRLTIQLLAEAARNLDSLSEEHGAQTVWNAIDLDARAAQSMSIRFGEERRAALRATRSDIPRERSVENAALSALWQDGLVVARLSLCSLNAGGGGPHPGDRIPPEEL